MLLHDLRFAARALARNPAYTLVALITLVLGIGANAAVFSIVNGVLLSPLPFPDPDRLVLVREVSGRGRSMQAARPNFEDWRAGATRFEELVAHNSGGQTTVLGAGAPLRAGVVSVSEGFFRALGVAPAVGRGFTADEHRYGADPAVVVSDAFWRTYLGGERDLSRRRLKVGGYDARVVGVMPPSFGYPAGIDIWYPMELSNLNRSRTSHSYVVVGRLKPGVAIAQADAELDAITRGIVASEPEAAGEEGFLDFFPQSALVVPLRQAIVGDTGRPLWILLGASLLVLLVACTNLGSTTLARGTAREREYAIRHALGANRGRMVSVVFAEVLSLTVAGAVLGLALGAVALRLLPALAPDIPRLDEVRLNGAVVAFTVALSLLTAALAGLLPGVRVSRTAITSLRSGTRGGDGRTRQRVWKWLVAVETALALVLLIGSGLLLRSFRSVIEVQPGYRTENVLLATVDPPSIRIPDNDGKRRYYDALLERLHQVQGVAAVGLVTAPPPSSVPNGLLDVFDGPSPTIIGEYQLVGDDYFAAMGIPLLRGRPFSDRDRAGTEPVAIVSEAFAREAWPGENPIGKRLTGGGMDDHWEDRQRATVIGVVADIRQSDLTRDGVPTLYFSYRQRPFRSWSMTAALRPAGGMAAPALIASVREAVAAVDTDTPVRFATIEQRLSGSLAQRRFVMMLIAVFAGIALLLACVGVYGVVAYAVERRRREIGIRMALGAPPRTVRRQLQRDYLVAGGLGALVGLGAALALTRVMASLLFGVSPTDPVTFAGTVVLLGAAGWLASLIPALRTTRIDPLETMRAE